jgi:hypothetical protein
LELVNLAAMQKASTDIETMYYFFEKSFFYKNEPAYCAAYLKLDFNFGGHLCYKWPKTNHFLIL